MNDKDIEKAGYKRFDYLPLFHEGATTFWQKRIVDDIGKKYFIDVYRYDFPEHPYTGDKIPTSYEFSMQFCKDGDALNVELLSSWNDKSIEEIEAFIEEMWTKLNLDYYEKWDEA